MLKIQTSSLLLHFSNSSFFCLFSQVNAYLSDVFEAPRLRDQMKQYDLVLKNLNKQKSYNEESCKRDMKYHRAR